MNEVAMHEEAPSAASPTPMKLLAALVKAQAEFPPIPKAKQGHGYKYAPLDVILRTVRPVMAKHGLGVRWFSAGDHIVTQLIHGESGETLDTPYPLRGVGTSRMNPAQSGAAADTYAQRYGFCHALGICADEDIDAHQNGSTEMGGLISADQFRELTAKLDVAGADPDKFAAYLGVETLEELPASRFADAVSALDRKARRNAA